MSNALKFNVDLREETGKCTARSLRRNGKVPAIIYGGNKKEVKISMSSKELFIAYTDGGFTSKVVELDAGKEKFTVIPRDIQLHPVTDKPLHADFMHITEGSLVNVRVKVKFSNSESSPGLKRGGILNVVRHNVELVCPAMSIPESITFDLTGAMIGDSIHISSVKLPDGVSTAIKRDFTIATVAGRAAKDDSVESATEEVSEEEVAE